jgi:oligoendopeptidase F
MESIRVPHRKDIPKEQTWNDAAVFADREAWREELAAVKASIPGLESFPGTLSDSPARLVQWYETLGALLRRFAKLQFYAYMAMAVDGEDAEAGAMVGQVGGLGAEIAARSAFADPELLAMDESTLKSWLASEDSLSPYHHSIEDLLRGRSHVRSGEVEEVLGMISEPFSAVEMSFSMLSSLDMTVENAKGSDGGEMEVTQSNIEEIKKHPDRELRRSGMDNYADAYLSLRNTYAANYLASAKQALTLSRIRGYSSVLEYKLDPFNIPTEVFHNLIDTFRKNLPLWHRYWDVKRRLLGLDEIKPHDIWAPLTAKQPEYTFRDAVELIAEGMSPLGSEYVETVRRGCLEERWVDYARNKGKSQGAFSYGTYDTYPCIMLSYDNTLMEVSTLAHELGHSMHSYLTHKHQSYFDSDYSMFVAEVASNFNQAMVRDHLFKTNSDRDFQLAVIQEAMDNIHRYFFIMPTLARFEYEVYSRLENGEALNADILQEIMSGLYAEGYGTALSDDSRRTSITWATFGHLYEPYYTFQYATGISAAHALCGGILEGKPGAVDDYLKFLSLGNSRYPIDALAVAGVDMRSTRAVEAGFAVLEALIDRLEGLI